LTVPIPGAELIVRELIESKSQLLVIGDADKKPVELLVTLTDHPHAAQVRAGSVVRVTDVLVSPLGRLQLRMTRGSELFTMSRPTRAQ
ncbi:MAG: hypothetical protein ACYDHH_32635, partial [Solirubrobacteraceae bacterium]